MVHVGPEVHLDNLTLALKNMTSLSTLKLIHSQIYYSSVLRYCVAKLRVFHCTYAIDFQFLNFLNRQDSIRNLIITGERTIDVYLASECEELCFFPHLCH
jgi:hypothetical protein